MKMSNKYYIAIDGDSIGKILEKYILTEDMINLKKFSNNLQNDIEVIGSKIISLGGQIYMKGGDNLLGVLDYEMIDEILSFLKNLNLSRTYHFSVGIALNSAETYIALKYAKLNRKDVIIYNHKNGFTEKFL